MNLVTCKIYYALRALIDDEEGQDLVEYAMIVVLLSLGAVVGMDSVGIAIGNIFGKLSEILYVALG